MNTSEEINMMRERANEVRDSRGILDTGDGRFVSISRLAADVLCLADEVKRLQSEATVNQDNIDRAVADAVAKERRATDAMIGLMHMQLGELVKYGAIVQNWEQTDEWVLARRKDGK